MFKLKQGQLPILIVNLISLVIFTFIFLSRANYEFLIYIGVIVLFLILIIFTNHKVEYNNTVLLGLTLWSIMHMSGGGLYFGGQKLYEIILIPLVGEPFNIFKYDQLVHMIGFGVATMMMFYLLKPFLNKAGKISVGIVVIMAGLGVGGLNEIIEFVVEISVPESGVGGYFNTSLDLVSNLIGAIIAWFIILKKEKKVFNSS